MLHTSEWRNGLGHLYISSSSAARCWRVGEVASMVVADRIPASCIQFYVKKYLSLSCYCSDARVPSQLSYPSGPKPPPPHSKSFLSHLLKRSSLRNSYSQSFHAIHPMLHCYALAFPRTFLFFLLAPSNLFGILAIT